MSQDDVVDRVAIDTGVWLESLLFGGSAEELIKMSVAEQVQLVTCEGLLEELNEILIARLSFSTLAAEAVVHFIRDAAEVHPLSAPGTDSLSRRRLLLHLAEVAEATAVATTESSTIHQIAASSSIPVVCVV